MKVKNFFLLLFVAVFTFAANAQEVTPNVAQGPTSFGTFYKNHVSPPIITRGVAPKQDLTIKEVKDKRSLGNTVIIGKDRQTQDDYFVRNRHESEQSVRVMPPSLVFDAYQSGSQPTDPSMAISPDHILVTFNTGFYIYDKNGNDVGGGTRPITDIFSGGGCCDITVSYDQAANRWVLSYLFSSSGKVEVAVSDGSDPLTASWNVYSIPSVNDYNKLSIWSDGYYLTANVGGSKVWALDRAAMMAGDDTATYQTFALPGIVTSGFWSPQALNVSDDNMPEAGGATFVYMQDDAWAGVSSDHLKVWTLDVDWNTPGNSEMSAATTIPLTPFISVFDGGSFSNLSQPGGGQDVDALQATIMNQAQFRKFSDHNSAIFNFVVDTDASAGELAGIRWIELRQDGDNQPWSLYQEGTYTAADGKHAWHGSLIMDSEGNIAMGYTSMAGPTTENPTDHRISSNFTGRFAGDALGVMTVAEETIANSTANDPSYRYGDYNKIDIDPSADGTFWFINEYFKGGRKGVVGKFTITPNTTVDDIGVTAITSPAGDGLFTANEEIVINIKNNGINDIVNPEVQYTINGGTAVVENYAGTLAAGVTESHTFATPADLSEEGTTYTIEARTNLSGDTVPENDAFVKEVTNQLVYCDPAPDCSVGDGFQLFSVSDLANISECEGYGDFTDMVATLAEGTTYDLTVTTGYGDQYVTVWIDFNDDGTFESSEKVVNNHVIAPGAGAGVHTETFDLVIPAVANNGLHRMRAKSNWNAGVPDDACEETNYGETEDYTALIGELNVVNPEIENAEFVVVTNPNNQFDITLTTAFEGIASIAIYNVLGQTLAFNNLEKQGDSFVYHLDMSYANPGVYYIKMGDNSSKTYKTAKIIVK